MRHQFSLASFPIFALALTACGGPPADPAETPDETAAIADDSVEPGATDVEDTDGEAVTDSAEPVDASEAPESDPSPTPTPSASASTAPRPAATPTQVVSMTPPAGFTTCAVCHSVQPGQNGVGPSLAGVVGRKAGSVAGFGYSAGMQGVNVTWNAANLERYLVDPASVVPGGSMPAPGLNAAQAKAVAEYLKTL